MLSAILLVFVGVCLTVYLSYRKNSRNVRSGRGGYRPRPGLIGWGNLEAEGGPSEAGPTAMAAGSPAASTPAATQVGS